MKKLNCILDLDNTLILKTNSEYNGDFRIKIHNKMYNFHKRPFLETFINTIFKKFNNIGIWTSATREYAENVLKNIIPEDYQNKISFLYTRENCNTDSHHKWNKNIEKVFKDKELRKEGFEPDNTIMIDNIHFGFKNTIQIKDYDKSNYEYDDELIKLSKVIERENSIRSMINNYLMESCY